MLYFAFLVSLFQTGSGFIAEEPSSSSFKIGEDGQKIVRTSSHTNPACNEWQPAPPQVNTQLFFLLNINKDEVLEPSLHSFSPSGLL